MIPKRVSILCMLVWAAIAHPASTKHVEDRDFAVLVDGKRCGTFRLTIAEAEDQVTTVTARADVRVTYLVFRYTYTYRGSEVWKGRRLQKMESTANDDGKPLSLIAALEKDVLRIRGNGHDRRTSSDVWPTTYWRLPDTKYHNGAITLLDGDTGKEIKARLEFVEFATLTISGRPQRCQHFRVTGEGLHVDVWYDTSGRLVRQESMEDGHRTVLELLSLRQHGNDSSQ